MNATLTSKGLRRKMIRMGLAKPCTREEHKKILQGIHDQNAAKLGLPPRRERTPEQQREWRKTMNMRYFAKLLGCDLSNFPPYIRRGNKN